MFDDVLVSTDSAIDRRVNKNCLNSFPLAMAYVPKQSWGELYSADTGLSRGTIFPELDKPFLGRRMKND